MARIDHVERLDFLQNRWPYLYELGEHVSYIEPTGQGKTQLAWQILQQTTPIFEDTTIVSLMPKSLSPATHRWATHLRFKIIDTWPPPSRFPWQEKPAGYVLWPKHLRGVEPKVNREHLAAIFQPCLRDQLDHGRSITYADDVHVLAVQLGLNSYLEEIWIAGAEGGAGLWSANQKPSGTIGGGSVSSFSYNAPSHLFLGKDKDERNQKRFSEIGGVNPRLVSEIVSELKIHPIQTPHGIKNISDKLYLCKRGYMCTVGI